MIRELTVTTYKSIVDHSIELGRINVFIGENGCGKTNILEAAAMAAAASQDKLDIEELHARGIRVAKPALTFSSFLKTKRSKEIRLKLRFDLESHGAQEVEVRLAAKGQSPVDVRWVDKNSQPEFRTPSKGVPRTGSELVATLKLVANERSESGDDSRLKTLAENIVNSLGEIGAIENFGDWMFRTVIRMRLRALVGEFAIYNPNVLALRGIQNVSRRTPVGIYGENLDVVISAMTASDKEMLIERARCISWLDDIVLDPNDELKHQGYKFGRSTSTLYFRDRFMPQKSNIFSAENANEGILHILFYLVLFASSNTPRFFGIDNVETALNPQLCRELIKQLVELAMEHDKQALITTHNPAILDGLNLHDDEQRLFVVSRSDKGYTVTRRIKLKPEAKDGQKYKLSELWMRGVLGGIPQRF